MNPLTGADKRFLRGLGHKLKVTLTIGKEGVSPGLLMALDATHEHHELVKVRVLDTCETHRKDVAEELEEKSDSHVAQVLGRTILVYRRHPEEPEIVLPSDKG